MKKSLEDKVREISRQTIIRWCKDTFEGEMYDVLANACKVVSINRLLSEIDPTKDLAEIDKLTKVIVKDIIKEYINNDF